jgi:hypothetical protein
MVSFKVLFRADGTPERQPHQVRDRGAMIRTTDRGIILTTGGFTAGAKRRCAMVSADRAGRWFEAGEPAGGTGDRPPCR